MIILPHSSTIRASRRIRLKAESLRFLEFLVRHEKNLFSLPELCVVNIERGCYTNKLKSGRNVIYIHIAWCVTFVVSGQSAVDKLNANQRDFRSAISTFSGETTICGRFKKKKHRLVTMERKHYTVSRGKLPRQFGCAKTIGSKKPKVGQFTSLFFHLTNAMLFKRKLKNKLP